METLEYAGRCQEVRSECRPVVDSSYQPTKAEMEEDVSIDAMSEEVVKALSSDDPPVVKSGKGEKSKKEFEAWLRMR